ncbi:MFS transporter [Paraburkholderia fungorum]
MELSSRQPPSIDAGISRHSSRHSLIFSTALGNGLEIFDFTVYSFFAAYIGNAFFPAKDPLNSLLFAVGTFGAGFFARPVGAIVLGGYADRAGRRAAMMLSIWLMAGGTVVIAMCPPFASVGLIAPLLVLCGRLLQGFAAGGEIGASTTYLMESNVPQRRGFMVSWQMVSQGAAATLGAVCGYSLTHLMPASSLASWGWRVPFLLGLVIAPVGYYIRRHLPESNPSDGTATRLPIVELIVSYRSRLAIAFFLTVGQSVTMYVIVFYMPSYLIRVMGFPASSGFATAVASSMTFTVLAFIGGLIADRLPRRKPIVLCTGVLSTLFCLPAFWIIVHTGSVATVVALVALMTGLLGAGVVATLLLLMEMFPPVVRATGFATAYALANTLFGGTAQFVVTALIGHTGNAYAAGFYVFLCNAIALVALLMLREEKTGGTGQRTA